MSATAISTTQQLTLIKNERQLERAHRNSVLQKRIHDGELELSRWQLLAARNTDHRLRIVASAGAGKTRTLANAIAAAATLHDAKHIAVITFTRKATRVIDGALTRNGVYGTSVSTLDSLALQILEAAGIHVTAITDDAKKKMLADIRKTCMKKQPHERITLKRLMHDTTYYAMHPDEQPESECLKAILEEYAERCKNNYSVEWPTIEQLAAQHYPQSGFRFEILGVDEAQDLNPAQIKLVESITATTMQTIVAGDWRQGIMSFQGAAPDWFRDGTHFDQTLELPINHRCAPEIVNAANHIFGDSIKASENATTGMVPQLIRANNEQDEAEKIAELVEDVLSDGHTAASNIRFLAWRRSQFRELKRTLAERNMPINEDAFRTIHSYKGDEANIIILVGVSRAVWGDRNDESDMLLYVGMTRARLGLIISYPDQTHLPGNRTSAVCGPYPTLEECGLQDSPDSQTILDKLHRDISSRHLLEDVIEDNRTAQNITIQKKQQSRVVASYQRLGNAKAAAKLTDCAEKLTFESMTDGNVRRSLLAHAWFCNQKTCNICMGRRAVRNQLHVGAALDCLFNPKCYRDLLPDELYEQITAMRFATPAFFTGTMPNFDDLALGIRVLNFAVRNLTHTDINHSMSERERVFTQGIVGTTRSDEATNRYINAGLHELEHQLQQHEPLHDLANMQLSELRQKINKIRTDGEWHVHAHMIFATLEAYYHDQLRKDDIKNGHDYKGDIVEANHLYKDHLWWKLEWTNAVQKAVNSIIRQDGAKGITHDDFQTARWQQFMSMSRTDVEQVIEQAQAQVKQCESGTVAYDKALQNEKKAWSNGAVIDIESISVKGHAMTSKQKAQLTKKPALLKSAIQETCKYAFKPDELFAKTSKEELDQIIPQIDATSGARLISRTGIIAQVLQDTNEQQLCDRYLQRTRTGNANWTLEQSITFNWITDLRQYVQYEAVDADDDEADFLS
ncbi:DEAD/DEAH box helicase [Bifidobacterium sp. LC6]|uniref:DEAD/DEAH box helicase n=1 Tax=Bifidobacterium colobi TaxID=2809026 RepID=A0ABS5USZ3_9BIFI|nr:DEAD/DEAH box helicase [Bifidobacterium colobi]MBT1174156.1 DEAD/DEAH box helicase [Bifidobacterium colobi]